MRVSKGSHPLLMHPDMLLPKHVFSHDSDPGMPPRKKKDAGQHKHLLIQTDYCGQLGRRLETEKHQRVHHVFGVTESW